MGREWLYNWVVGGGGVGKSSTRRRRSSAAGVMMEDEHSSTAGCMCAVFQLFDLHHFQLPLNHHHPLTPLQEEETTTPKGVEAPRNSLELEEPTHMNVAASMPLAMKKKQEENLKLPVGIEEIKTRVPISPVSKSRTEDFPSESISPGTKSPNLVARLMGLDLLPQCTSPSLLNPHITKSHHSHRQKKDRTNINHDKRSNACNFSDDDISIRSLPETPRISSSSRRSDVENHRLSLQINKENQEFEFGKKMTGRRRSLGQRREEENRSARHYAKQILNQVRESVLGRRVGLVDITNRETEKQDIRRDQNLVLLKPAKKNYDQFSPDSGKQSVKSPKLGFSDKHVPNSDHKSPRISASSSSSLKPKNQKIIQEINPKPKKLSHQSTTCDHSSMRKKKLEEPFVRSDKKLIKKRTLSSEMIQNASGPGLHLPVKKDPSPPATKLPQKQSQVPLSDALSSKRNTQLSSNSSRSYNKHLHLPPHPIFSDNTNGRATASSAAAPEYKSYIQKILRRTGITDKAAPLTLGKWHTPSHPLDPSIFFYLELFQPSTGGAAVLGRRSNRKLVFHLVDELLAEILRPHLDFKPWMNSPITGNGHNPGDLVDDLCRRIEGFPAADCRVLEDIDSLIGKDLCESGLNGFLEEEGEGLVREIEGEIFEGLVRETAAIVGGGGTAADRWMSRDEMPLIIGSVGIKHPRLCRVKWVWD